VFYLGEDVGKLRIVFQSTRNCYRVMSEHGKIFVSFARFVDVRFSEAFPIFKGQGGFIFE